MDITSLTSATGLNFNDPAVALRETGKQVLDANDFLKLLSVQLQSQDPLKPMEDTQFISQMASFTSLEQMRDLASNMKAFTASQRLVSAQDYLGKFVTIQTDNGDVSGEVTAISIVDGDAKLKVGAKDYAVSDVISVSTRPIAPTPSSPPTPTLGPAPTSPQPTLGTGPSTAPAQNQ
jgi:flagellar basal-body rod modification protein FlgD